MSKRTDHFESLAKSHITISKAHGAMERAHDMLSKADVGEDSEDFHGTCRDAHRDARIGHAEIADQYLQCCKADVMDFEKTQATARQAINDVEKPFAEAVAIGAVDPVFAKLVALDERDEN